MMKWHKEGKRYNPNKIVHPSEGEAWKSFDIEYPEEATEAGNVRIAISGDGFIRMVCRLIHTAAGPYLIFRSISLPAP